MMSQTSYEVKVIKINLQLSYDHIILVLDHIIKIYFKMKKFCVNSIKKWRTFKTFLNVIIQVFISWEAFSHPVSTSSDA